MAAAEEVLKEERRLNEAKVLAGMYVPQLDLTYLPIPKCGHHAISQAIMNTYPKLEWVLEPRGEVVVMIRDPLLRLESFYGYSKTTNPQYARTRGVPVETWDVYLDWVLSKPDEERNRHVQSQCRLVEDWEIDTVYRWDWGRLAERLDVGTIGRTNFSQMYVSPWDEYSIVRVLEDPAFKKDKDWFDGKTD